ncbi:uncharacterized protein LOC119569328 [Penaeus monodon]|uniref:uncharacterized protein LOC119569328 n=1 Tax=Penaeus monodon TaxID=6687 RepID=UPI0018A7A0BC|nr:uncharacterized protein LOC119569328 [Penaeus monodon]
MVALMGLEYKAHGLRATSRLSVRRLVGCPKALYQMPPPRSSLSKTFFTCSGALCIRGQPARPRVPPGRKRPRQHYHQESDVAGGEEAQGEGGSAAQVPMFSLKEVKEQTLIKTDEPITLAPGVSVERNVTLMVTAPSKTQGEIRRPRRPGPSTIPNPNVDFADIFGIHVNYVVRVKAVFGALTGDAVLDLPFTLAIER